MSHWICLGPRNISKIITVAREIIDYSRVPSTPTLWSQLHSRDGYKRFHREKVEVLFPQRKPAEWLLVCKSKKHPL